MLLDLKGVLLRVCVCACGWLLILLQVTLEDLYNGKTTKLAVQRNVLCSSCNGRGGKVVSVRMGKEGGMREEG